MTVELDPPALFHRLGEAGVRYIVVGGFAAIAYGIQRSTTDLDICPDPDTTNLDRLALLLRDLDARHADSGDFDQEEFSYDPTDPAQLAEGGNFRLETSLGALDVMQWIPGISGELAYPKLIKGAIRTEVHGVPVTICSRADLVSMKRTAGRPIDQADLDQLEQQEEAKNGS